VSQEDQSISCGSPTACLAVGGTGPGLSVAAAVALEGTTWKTITVPAPDPSQDSAGLGVVSCKAATYCLVTGAYEANGNLDNIPYLLTWNGTSLALIPTPPVPGGDTLSSFDAVSCVAVKSCVVFGSVFDADGHYEMAWTWNGSKWARRGAASPGWRAISVSFARCFSLTSCEVAGAYAGDRMADANVMFAVWNGKKFTRQRAAVPADILHQGFFSGLSCVSPRSCAAVGTSGSRSFLAVWNGKTWTVTQWTGPKNGDAYLSGVSCVTATNCVAVGWSATQQEQTEGAVSFIWNGTKWLKAGVPGAGPGLMTYFSGVSCPKADRCVAIGDYYPVAYSYLTMAGYWNGRGWKLTGV
jgi:hypothetical protein